MSLPEPTVPMTAAKADKTTPTGLPNRIVWFAQIRAGASGSSSFHVQTHFSDSAGELTTSSMKGGNSGNNGSNLDKGNILKPTFDTLTEEGRKTFDAYRTNLEEIFLSCCKVTRHGTVLKDTTSIIFNKSEVIPAVRPNPSLSYNDVQVMINSALERQAKSTDEVLHRLIEEWDGKNLMQLVVILLLLLALLVLLKPIHT
jgi:hypothetical protein